MQTELQGLCISIPTEGPSVMSMTDKRRFCVYTTREATIQILYPLKLMSFSKGKTRRFVSLRRGASFFQHLP